MCDLSDTLLDRAADIMAEADALLIGAGAGMGVDSGLPDFRGDEGFWQNYPPFEERGLDFYDLARPRWFEDDPALAWGFYGHRLQLYRETEPHEGFERLRELGHAMTHPPFVLTSNVDGQFQKAGYDRDRILECHGTIHHLQCREPCRSELWSADTVDLEIDETTFRAQGHLPECPHCRQIARPNVLMFGDRQWIGSRTADQKTRFEQWLHTIRGDSVVVVECGAGTAVPTVRRQCEHIASRFDGTLIRINPDEPNVPDDAVSLAGAALDTLRAIDKRLA